ncbi:MAG TPA: DUF6056 family protein [Bacteroidales bacterium]|nr:DUF6056 family protein [Bacteroidales bacterium]
MKILNNYFFWILLLIGLVAPFFVLSFYVFPSADDFSVYNLLQQHSFCEYQEYMYMNWAGRYMANITDALNPVQCIIAYRLIPVFLLLLLFVSLFVFFRCFFKKFLSTLQLLLFTLVFYALYLNIFPSPAEGIYWYPGAKNYLLANILLLFFLSALYKMMFAAKSKMIFYWCAALVLAFLIIGLNEISLLLVCGLTLLLLAANGFVNHKLSLPVLLMFVFMVFFAVVAIAAPGNFIRMSFFDSSMHPGQSVVMACVSLIKLLCMHFQNAAFVLLSLLVLPFVYSLISAGGIHYRFLINPFLLAFFSLLMLFVLFLPGYLGMGLPPPMRVNALLSLVFLFLWLLNLINLCHFLYLKKISLPALPPWFEKVLLLCTVLLVLSDFYKEPAKAIHFRSNIPGAYYDLFVNASAYKREMQDRDKTIDEAKKRGEKDVEVDAMKMVPPAIFFVDLKTDSASWINRSYAEYYGLHSIILKPSNSGEKTN